MFKGITLDMRLDDLGYQPRKIPDYIVVDCYDKERFTKEEVSTLTDLATIYDISLFSVNKDHAKFYDQD